jgi:hypothetical protein
VKAMLHAWNPGKALGSAGTGCAAVLTMKNLCVHLQSVPVTLATSYMGVAMQAAVELVHKHSNSKPDSSRQVIDEVALLAGTAASTASKVDELTDAVAASKQDIEAVKVRLQHMLIRSQLTIQTCQYVCFQK